jgi:hypothetical protein
VTLTDPTPPDGDLAARIHALRGPLARRRPATAPAELTATVRARVRRARAQARAALAGAVVLVLAAAVGLPFLQAAGEPTRDAGLAVVVPAEASGSGRPVTPHAWGGVTITWLPAGMTPGTDTAGRGLNPDENDPAVQQPLGSLLDQGSGDTFVSAFTGAALDSAAVLVDWKPATFVTDLVAGRVSGQGSWKGVTRQDSVGGRPASLVTVDLRASAAGGYWATHGPRYALLLTWVTPAYTVVGVELGGNTPPDSAVAHRIAAGLVVGHEEPPSPYAPDPETAAAVTAAFRTALTAGVPDTGWASAVQDGEALTRVRDEILAIHPGVAGTLTVSVTHLVRANATTVRADLALTWQDPNLIGSAAPGDGQTFSVTGTAVRTAQGWQLSRATYCDGIVATMGGAHC